MNKRTAPSKKDARRKYHFEMTSWTIFAWLSCLFLLMSWIFVLGILVGRGFIPESVTAIADLRNQINKLQERVFQSQKPGQEAQKGRDYDSKLAFYNELADKKEEEKKKNLLEGKPEPAGKEIGQKQPAVTPQPSAEGRPGASSKEGVAKVKTEIARTYPEGKDKGGAANLVKKGNLPAMNGFTLQVAALADRVKAQDTVEGLVKKGYDAHYQEVEIRGKTWYRIRCGRFATKDEAENYARKLAGETGLKGLVIKIE
jgi:cell division septation protein DedD